MALYFLRFFKKSDRSIQQSFEIVARNVYKAEEKATKLLSRKEDVSAWELDQSQEL